MAKTAWTRPRSLIGKKGPRKVNPKYKRRAGEPGTAEEVRELRALAKGNTPTGVISPKLGRPPAGIRGKHHREGISLRPVKQAVQGYLAHGALSRGTAIAFYVVTSLAPVLIIVVAVAGLAFGEDAVRGKLIRELRGRRQGGEPGKNLLARSGEKSTGAAA
jgi:hypothetical protein